MIDFLFFGFLIEHVNPKSFQGISHEDKSMLIFLSFCSAMHCTVNHGRAVHLPWKPNWPSYLVARFDFFPSMMEAISIALNLWAVPWLHPTTNTTCNFLTFRYYKWKIRFLCVVSQSLDETPVRFSTHCSRLPQEEIYSDILLDTEYVECLDQFVLYIYIRGIWKAQWYFFSW